jgi:general stress protein CsbA
MKAGILPILYTAVALVLVIALIETPAYTKYTGEIFIVLFICILLFAWGNSIRQTQKLLKEKPEQTDTPASN